MVSSGTLLSCSLAPNTTAHVSQPSCSLPVSFSVTLFLLFLCLFIFFSSLLRLLYHISFQLLCLYSFLCLFHSFSLFLSVYVSFSPVRPFFPVLLSLRLFLSLSGRHKSLSCWLLKCEEWQIWWFLTAVAGFPRFTSPHCPLWSWLSDLQAKYTKHE